MIRERCVGADCESTLPGTEEYYENHGNYCTRCEWKANRNMLQRMLEQRLKNTVWNSPDEADEAMLLLN